MSVLNGGVGGRPRRCWNAPECLDPGRLPKLPDSRLLRPWGNERDASDGGDARYDVGEGSVGDPASARPSRLEIEGREQRESSIGGEGGGRGGRL